MYALARMRKAIRGQRYRISAHANVEMSEDDLTAGDVENVILTGRIARKFSHDPRGTRYEVLGFAVDDRQAHVVCRFLSGAELLIITAYLREEK